MASDRLQRRQLPTLSQLGDDLLHVTRLQWLITVTLPFIAVGFYVLFAWVGWWPLAVVSVMTLSFVSYGSTSHDLVHRSLHLPPGLNDFLLSTIELLSLRSGTAYRLSHLNHHRHMLDPEDIEGEAAHGSLLNAIVNGVFLQPRLWLWAWNKHSSQRSLLLLEGVGVCVLITASVLVFRWTIVPLTYVMLTIAGSWLFPLVTVYIPHDSRGGDFLSQTRLFRGRILQYVAFNHLYHLEHHLYPAVPHHHWKDLATRLDPHFQRLGIKPRA